MWKHVENVQYDARNVGDNLQIFNLVAPRRIRAVLKFKYAYLAKDSLLKVRGVATSGRYIPMTSDDKVRRPVKMWNLWNVHKQFHVFFLHFSKK